MIHFPVTLLQIAFEIYILVLYNLLLNSIEGQDKKYVSIEIALITQSAGKFCELVKTIFIMVNTCGILQIS